MDDVLVAARNPYGGRRFYPPGSHPALWRMNETVKKLEQYPSSPDRDRCLADLRERIAVFEEGESRAKQEHLARCR